MECYGLRGIYGRFDSKIRLEIESDSRFDPRFDSNAKKNDSQVPKINHYLQLLTETSSIYTLKHLVRTTKLITILGLYAMYWKRAICSSDAAEVIVIQRR